MTFESKHQRDHKAVVREEFTHQAKAYATASAITNEDRLSRLVTAISPGSNDRALEVATGPGYVAMALAARCGEVIGLVAWSGFAGASFSFTCGLPTRYTSSAGVERSFCSRCGTQLTYRRLEAPDAVDVTMGSMDDPEALAPQDHTWVASRLSWIALSDGLPTYDRNRTS